MSPKHLLVLVLAFVAVGLGLIAFARVIEAPTSTPSLPTTQFDEPLARPTAPVLL